MGPLCTAIGAPMRLAPRTGLCGWRRMPAAHPPYPPDGKVAACDQPPSTALTHFSYLRPDISLRHDAVASFQSISAAQNSARALIYSACPCKH